MAYLYLQSAERAHFVAGAALHGLSPVLQPGQDTRYTCCGLLPESSAWLDTLVRAGNQALVEVCVVINQYKGIEVRSLCSNEHVPGPRYRTMASQAGLQLSSVVQVEWHEKYKWLQPASNQKLVG